MFTCHNSTSTYISSKQVFISHWRQQDVHKSISAVPNQEHRVRFTNYIPQKKKFFAKLHFPSDPLHCASGGNSKGDFLKLSLDPPHSSYPCWTKLWGNQRKNPCSLPPRYITEKVISFTNSSYILSWQMSIRLVISLKIILISWSKGSKELNLATRA